MTSEERAPREDRPGGDGAASERPARTQQRRYGSRKKICRICNKHRCSPGEYMVDYKDIPRLRMLVSERGKIDPRRKTGACALGQRSLATAVKRARHLAMLPYTLEHVRKTRIFPTRG